MRFVSARHGDRRFAGAVIDDAVVPLDGVSELGPATPSSLLRAPSLRRGEGLPLADVELLPVVPNPRKIVCVGSNYRAHVEEMGRELPGYPVLFTKFASSLIGPYATIVAPPESQQIDFEAEIAVVIGTAGRRIQAAAALDHVAGYAIVNHVTMRDIQYLTGPIAIVYQDVSLTGYASLPPGLPSSGGVVRTRVTWVVEKRGGSWEIVFQQMTPRL